MPRTFTSLACVALLAVSGCGGGDKQKSPTSATGAPTQGAPRVLSAHEYADSARKATAEYGAAGRELSSQLNRRTSPARAARALARFQTRVNGAVAALEALRPPAPVTAAHGDLVAALHDVALACEPTIHAGRARDKRKFGRALKRLRSDLQHRLGPRAKRAAKRVDAGVAAV